MRNVNDGYESENTNTPACHSGESRKLYYGYYRTIFIFLKRKRIFAVAKIEIAAFAAMTA